MRVTVADAAKLMEVSPQFIRIGLQRKLLPIGVAVKMSSRWTYYISPERLDQYLGKKNPPAATGGAHEG